MSNEIAICNYIVELIPWGYKNLQRFRNKVDHWNSEGSAIMCFSCSPKHFPRHCPSIDKTRTQLWKSVWFRLYWAKQAPAAQRVGVAFCKASTHMKHSRILWAVYKKPENKPRKQFLTFSITKCCFHPLHNKNSTKITQQTLPNSKSHSHKFPENQGAHGSCSGFL